MVKLEIDKSYLEKALEMAAGAATRASNAKGINPMIRELYQKDAKIYADASRTIVETK